MIDFLNRGSTHKSVNVPNVQCPQSALKPGTTRVLCFHKNVPGVLRDINNCLSNGNITYQVCALRCFAYYHTPRYGAAEASERLSARG